LFEIGAGLRAGLERGADLVGVQHLLLHGVDLLCRGVAAVVVAQPDHRRTLPFRWPVAEPHRMTAADGAGRWLLGCESVDGVAHQNRISSLIGVAARVRAGLAGLAINRQRW